MARNIDYAKIPMGKNDIGAKTIGEYFEKLLLTLWDEQEDFSGKRPFGNSGWEYDVYASLISAGIVDGSLDEEGCVDEVAYSAANNIICEMIKQIFATPTADVVPKAEVLNIIEGQQDEIKKLERTLRNSLPSYCQVISEEKAIELGKEYGRREVAREIFEEIEENILKSVTIPCVSAEGYITPLRASYWSIDPNDYATLKKQYMEGEKYETKWL